MLVLSRRHDEEIVIDGRIRIKVLASSGGKVRLGISAPQDVRIERAELSGNRTIECLTPPRRDGLLFDARSDRTDSRSLTSGECDVSTLQV